MCFAKVSDKNNQFLQDRGSRGCYSTVIADPGLGRALGFGVSTLLRKTAQPATAIRSGPAAESQSETLLEIST